MKKVLAFDFGASSGRAIRAVFDGEKIDCEEIHRFDNIPLNMDGHICHDVEMILNEIKTAVEKAGDIDSLAFDTWGVDYGLLDSGGKLIHMPYHYRDTRTRGVLERADRIMSLSQLYNETGIQIMDINTLFQLICDENLKNAETLLFMPDLFTYFLTGKRVCEKTIASTSQMMNPVTGDFSPKILDTFGIDRNIFAPITESAKIAGEYKGIKVISVAGHDTQCAVAAMPLSEENAAFLSCGTWSLIGCELDEPVLTEKSNSFGLSNELGANGKINYLKNISGLWLIQETRRALAEKGKKYSYNDLETVARDSESFKCFLDPDDEMLSSHGRLPEKIAEYCVKTGQPQPSSTGEIVRCIYESLVLKYRFAIRQISDCTGKKFELLHMLGGGTKDSFLCQLTADSLGIPVTAGPVEATALGNIILQLVALGEISCVDEGRRIIEKTNSVKVYKPSHSLDWDEAYGRFLKIITK